MREAFLKVLGGESIDEIVWTADISYWINGQVQQKTADPSWQTEQGYLRFCRELGFMPYFWFEKFWIARADYDGSVETITQTQGARTIVERRTPVGTLREESTFLVDTCSTAHTKYAVENENDLKTLLYLLEHRRLSPDNLDDYNERLKLWANDDGVPCLGMPRSPLPALFVEWTGVLNGVYLMLDHPELTRRILSLLEEQEQPILDAVCDLAPPLVHFPDNLTSETFTGCFDEHMAGVYRRRLERLGAAGVRSAVHLDGTVRGLLPKLAGVGIDAIEALTPLPAGDVAVEEMRPLAQSDRVILWGGVPGAMFAPPYTWADVEKHVEHLLQTWKDTPFVVGVADQVPPNGDIAFVRKISELLKTRS